MGGGKSSPGSNNRGKNAGTLWDERGFAGFGESEGGKSGEGGEMPEARGGKTRKGRSMEVLEGIMRLIAFQHSSKHADSDFGVHRMTI